MWTKLFHCIHTKHTRPYPVNSGVLVTRRHFIHELTRVESARPSVHKPNHCPPIVGHASQDNGTYSRRTYSSIVKVAGTCVSRGSNYHSLHAQLHLTAAPNPRLCPTAPRLEATDGEHNRAFGTLSLSRPEAGCLRAAHWDLAHTWRRFIATATRNQ
jgi:hypothetical protein